MDNSQNVNDNVASTMPEADISVDSAAYQADPQSAVMSQGWEKTLNTAMPYIDQQLQNNYKTAVAASQGDPLAQQQVAENSLGRCDG